MLAVDLERHLEQLTSPQAQRAARRWIAKVRSGAVMEKDRGERLLDELKRICVTGSLQPLLAAYEITQPTYNYLQPPERNIEGPWARCNVPASRRATSRTWQVLGLEIGYPIGVPASPLTVSAEWIDYYAKLGFNLITRQTVRTEEHLPYPHPNWIFLEKLMRPIALGAKVKYVTGSVATWPARGHAFSMANSFGLPSPHPRVWQADIHKALLRLRGNQILIVSVTGTFEHYFGRDFIADFVKVARLAEKTGAPAIELRLSCPNAVRGPRNRAPLCESSEDTRLVVEAVRAALRPETRIVGKFSYMPRVALEPVLFAVGAALDGVSGINTIPLQVRRQDGRAAFEGAGRRNGGISGVAILEHGLDFTRSVKSIKDQHGFAFAIIGMGGVMTPDHVQKYEEAGAEAVQTATGAFFNPLLASGILSAARTESEP